jgi:hypothetical protein
MACILLSLPYRKGPTNRGTLNNITRLVTPGFALRLLAE